VWNAACLCRPAIVDAAATPFRRSLTCPESRAIETRR
jgi:hypothetical protein